ncbi:MAG: 5-deoxy-glucuronate isomerase, partial [Candidatus Dormiibacterota bacterium]
MNPKLLVHSRPAGGADGLVVSVTPESAGWKFVGFEVYRLTRGARIERETGDQEVCAVMLSGRADVSFGDKQWRGVGTRLSVFEGTPDAVYAPPGGRLVITATGDPCEVALCSAPAQRGEAPALLPGTGVSAFKRGSGRTERTIHNILMDDRPAESLLVTE